MTLTIDTSSPDLMLMTLEIDKKKYQSKIKASQKQAEKLLVAIIALLKRFKLDLKDLKKIRVQSEGDSFTSLRIGVLNANALAYALKIPVEALNDKPALEFSGLSVVAPSYKREPNIGKPKQSVC